MTSRWLAAVGAAAVLATCAGTLAASTASGIMHVAHSSAGSGFLLRPAIAAQGCTPPRQIEDRPAPATVRATLSVLDRRRTSVDGLPVLNRPDGRSSADIGWLPVRTFDAHGLRRRPNSTSPVYVVPSAAVLELDAARVGAPCPSRLNGPVAPGACLVIGPPGGPLSVGCWTLAQIRRGRALALISRGGSHVLVGLVPSRTTDVLTGDDGSRLALRSVDGVIYRRTRLPLDGHVHASIRRSGEAGGRPPAMSFRRAGVLFARDVRMNRTP